MSLSCSAYLSWVSRRGGRGEGEAVRVLTDHSSPFLNGEKHENLALNKQPYRIRYSTSPRVETRKSVNKPIKHGGVSGKQQKFCDILIEIELPIGRCGHICENPVILELFLGPKSVQERG